MHETTRTEESPMATTDSLIAQLPEADRRHLLTLDAAIRFAEATAKVAKDATRRFEAGERAAELRREETRFLMSLSCEGCGWDRWTAANPTAPHRHDDAEDGDRAGCCAHTCGTAR